MSDATPGATNALWRTLRAAEVTELLGTESERGLTAAQAHERLQTDSRRRRG